MRTNRIFDQVQSYILASRPKTLIASLCPVLMGACLSFRLYGQLDYKLFGAILLAAFCIQIATNFFNDALDFEEGRDRSDRLGPDRASLEGLIKSKDLKIAASINLFIAFLLGIVLVLHSGFPILLIGLSALVLAYLYTGTSFSLASNGVADLFVILYFGVFAVWGTSYILAGQNMDGSLLAGLQCGLLCNVLLLVNNLRDEKSDIRSNKKTLVVKYGRKLGLGFLFSCLFVPYILNFFWLGTVFYRLSFWTFLGFPLAVFIFYKIYNEEPSKEYNKYIGLSALHQLIFVVMFCLGVLSL